MPVSALLIQAFKRESDEAMRMAIDAMVPIQAGYRFTERGFNHESKRNGD